MSKTDIKVPSVGESVTEGVLSRWIKKSGDYVKAGEGLFELETDKAAQEVRAPASGVLLASIKEGTTVAIGSVVGSIDTSAAAPAAGAAVSGAAATAAASASAPTSSAHLSPAVAYQVAEKGVDVDSVTPTGPGGRITKGDVLAAAESKSAAPAAVATAPPAPSLAPVALSAERAATRQKMPTIRQRIAQRLVEAQQTAA
ncbi:MAG: biotin/lipoyl-containing protein, partial [bacterium]